MKYRKLAFRLSIISGLLLVLSGTTGIATWSRIAGIVLNVVDMEPLRIAFIIIMIMASLGGITVIIGGYLIMRRYDRAGGLLVLVGSGSGIISLSINMVLAFITGDLTFGWFLSSATLGIILAVAVQVMTVKKVQKFLRKI